MCCVTCVCCVCVSYVCVVCVVCARVGIPLGDETNSDDNADNEGETEEERADRAREVHMYVSSYRSICIHVNYVCKCIYVFTNSGENAVIEGGTVERHARGVCICVYPGWLRSVGSLEL